MSDRFSPGDRVRVRTDPAPGHIRTPAYIRGKLGVVTRIFGDFPNPEGLAYGQPGLPEKTLYEVRFRQSEIWSDYDGEARDTVDIDIYHHWLETASGATG
jgi:nitrile hydratase